MREVRTAVPWPEQGWPPHAPAVKRKVKKAVASGAAQRKRWGAAKGSWEDTRKRSPKKRTQAGRLERKGADMQRRASEKAIRLVLEENKRAKIAERVRKSRAAAAARA